MSRTRIFKILGEVARNVVSSVGDIDFFLVVQFVGYKHVVLEFEHEESVLFLVGVLRVVCNFDRLIVAVGNLAIVFYGTYQIPKVDPIVLVAKCVLFAAISRVNTRLHVRCDVVLFAVRLEHFDVPVQGLQF